MTSRSTRLIASISDFIPGRLDRDRELAVVRLIAGQGDPEFRLIVFGHDYIGKADYSVD